MYLNYLFLIKLKLVEMIMFGKQQTKSGYIIVEIIRACVLDFSICLGDCGMGRLVFWNKV